MASSVRIREDGYVAGSDHKLLSCVITPPSLNIPKARSSARYSSLLRTIRKIRMEDMKPSLLRTAVMKELKNGRKDTKGVAATELGPLLLPEHTSELEEYREDWVPPTV